MYRACCSLLFNVHRNIRSGPKDYLVGRLTLKGKMGNELLAPPLEERVRLSADC
jgi:hypothetical protein